MLSLTIILLAGLAFLAYQYRALEAKHKQLLDAYEAKEGDRQEAISTVERLAAQLENYADRARNMHVDSHKFFCKLLLAVSRMPRYKIPDREKNHYANKLRDGMIKLVAGAASTNPDSEPDELWLDLRADIEQTQAWLATQMADSKKAPQGLNYQRRLKA